MDGISSQVATVDYLSLMAIQLQNQDPMDPVDQESLIKDLAQFSMLEGIENLNASFSDMLKLTELTQGINLVGKQIQYQTTDGTIEAARVEQVFNSGGEIRIDIGDQTIGLDGVLTIAE